MKPDIVRQPLPVAFLTLLAFSLALVARLGTLLPDYEITGGVSALLGGSILQVQELCPRLMKAVCVLLVFYTGVSLGRITVRYGLYSVHTYLAIPLFGLLATGIFVCESYLIQYLAGFLLLLAVRNFYAAFRNGYGFTAVFRGAFYFGLLPMIYAPALLLASAVPLAIFLFKRSAREGIVALFGFLLPLFAYSYVVWGGGGAFTDPTLTLWESFIASSDFQVMHLPLPVQVLLGIFFLLVLLAGVCYFRDLYSVGLKPRAILLFNLLLFIVSAALFFVPSGTAAAVAIAAVPMATLLPILFVRCTPAVAMCLYLGLIGACAAVLLL